MNFLYKSIIPSFSDFYIIILSAGKTTSEKANPHFFRKTLDRGRCNRTCRDPAAEAGCRRRNLLSLFPGRIAPDEKPSDSELRVATRNVFDAALQSEVDSGGSRSSALLNFSSLGGGTAAANTESKEHEACAASNTAAGEIRLHHEKMHSHFPSLVKSMGGCI